MSIPLPYLLQIKYPDIILGENVLLSDHGDGQGAVISQWGLSETQPTSEDLLSMQDDSDIKVQYQIILNTQINTPILEQLDEIDLKSIRPLRENDTARMAALASQASALRAQLLPMTASGIQI